MIVTVSKAPKMNRKFFQIAVFLMMIFALAFLAITGTRDLREAYGNKNIREEGKEILQGEFLIWETMGNTVLSRGF